MLQNRTLEIRPAIALLGILLLTTLGVAQAATPSSGTVSEASPVVTWSGNPQPPTASATCNGPNDPACDNFQLSVVPPSFGFKVDITITPTGGDDYDLQVYNAAGQVVGSSGNSPGQPEKVTLQSPAAGTYTVAVANYAAALAYQGRAEIKAVSGGGPGNEDISFAIYTAPDGMGTNSGEPSIGSNWNSDRLMYIAGLETLRIEMDECTSPADAEWTDVSFTTTSLVTLDPILFTDSRTGRTFASQLGPKCSAMAFTDDDGETWTPSQGCGINSGVDHQTVGGGRFADPLTRDENDPLYQHAVYYCSQDVAIAQCALSLDGGLTFGPAVPIYNITQCGGLHGHVKVAPNDGTVYMPNKGCTGQQAVVASHDNGATWEVRHVEGSTADEWDPSVGVGLDGTVYVGMDNGGRPFTAVSTDEGRTWSNLQDVGVGAGPGGLDILNTAFPVVVAGDGDRAAFGFLGAVQGGDGGGTNPASDHVWYPYVSVTYDRGLTWTTVNLSPDDPVQRGNVCSSGTTCGSSRNLLDFNDMTVDREGRVVFGYADGCLGDCKKSLPNSGAELATFARQVSGKRLFAAFDTQDVPAAPRATAEFLDELETEVLIAWDEPDDHGSPITAYHIYRRFEGETSATLLSIEAATARTYQDMLAPTDPQVFYQVLAVNAFGESPSCREISPESITVTPCTEPGPTILSDAAGDATTQQPEHDVLRLAISQPLAAGEDNIVFTLKMASLANPTPNTTWPVVFTGADGNPYFAKMATDATGAVSFQVGQGTNPSVAGVPAAAGSSFAADGTIRIVVPKSLIGSPAVGSTIGPFLTRIRLELAGGSALTPDNMPGSLAAEGSHTVTDCSGEPPIARDDAASTGENQTVVVNVVANDTSFNGALVVTSVSDPAKGAVSNNGDGTVSYLPDAGVPASGFPETDTFTYTIKDEAGLSDSATVTITINPECPPDATGTFSDDFEPDAEAGWLVDTVANTVGPLSPPWDVVADAGATSPANSFFSDGSTLDLKDDRLIAPPQDLSATSQLVFWHRHELEDTYDGGVLEISTDDGSTWVDVIDGGGSFVEGAYNGIINSGFDSPIAGRAAWTGGSADSAMSRVIVNLGAFAGVDVRVRWRLATDPFAPGAVPGAGWWIDDVTFTNTLQPGICNGPDARDDYAFTEKDTPVTIPVLDNDFSPDGEPLTVTGVTQPANGTATTDGTTVTYTPNPGFVGIDAFTYTVCDSRGLCDTATVTVEVSGEPLPPNAEDDGATTEQDTPVTIDVLANDSDPEGQPLTAENVSDPANGTAVDNGDGTVTYTPDAGFTGTDTFTYQACDTDGLCDGATVTVTVTPAPGADGKVTGGGWIPGSAGNGKRNFGFNAKTKSDGTVDGRITYDRGSGGLDLKGTASTLSILGNEATFSGPCTAGSTPCTYTAVVEDNGEPGDSDRFSIEVRDLTGAILHFADSILGGGNIQIH